MRTLEAIVFDFDGVLADCQNGTLLPGAERFVREAARKCPLGIASGAATGAIEMLLDRYHLRRHFVAVVGADQTLRSKPAPDPYLEAMYRIGSSHLIEPGRTIAIDDSVWGLVAARAAKLRCVGIGRDSRVSELASHAELVVSGLDELTLDMLATLVNRDR